MAALAPVSKDAVNVKSVWDVISMVQTIYTEWKKTKWDDINVEELQEQNKKLQKEVKGCDKMVKNWPCYKGLEDSVKNMQSSLPLVEELRSKAMRDRHIHAKRSNDHRADGTRKIGHLHDGVEL